MQAEPRGALRLDERVTGRVEPTATLLKVELERRPAIRASIVPRRPAEQRLGRGEVQARPCECAVRIEGAPPAAPRQRQGIGGESFVQRVDRIAFLEQGGAFPPDFDSSKLSVPEWGSLQFSFNDCDNGMVTWTSNAASAAAGYANTTFPIKRLTSIAGTTCP